MQRCRSLVNTSSTDAQSFRVPARYQFSKLLGSGSYGTVAAFYDACRGRDVAIKRVKRVFDNFLVLRRTLREVRLMRHFAHPNLLRLHKVLPLEGSTGDIHISIELMDCDLDTLIHARHVELSEQQVKRFSSQMLLGLLCLHSGHVVHRDLKPANIFVRMSMGQVKIGDLGLSRGIALDGESGEATHPSDEQLTEYVVTRWYRAPEVLLARSKYGPPVDVWSVGCIVHEMWSRKALFPGKNSYDQLRRVVQVMGTPSDSDSAWVPAESRPLLQRCCQPSSSDNDNRGSAQLGASAPNAIAAELLKSMCAFDPNQRSSVEEALQHQYLAAVVTDEDIWTAKKVEPADVTYDRMFDGIGKAGETAALLQLGRMIKMEITRDGERQSASPAPNQHADVIHHAKPHTPRSGQKADDCASAGSTPCTRASSSVGGTPPGRSVQGRKVLTNGRSSSGQRPVVVDVRGRHNTPSSSGSRGGVNLGSSGGSSLSAHMLPQRRSSDPEVKRSLSRNGAAAAIAGPVVRRRSSEPLSSAVASNAMAAAAAAAAAAEQPPGAAFYDSANMEAVSRQQHYADGRKPSVRSTSRPTSLNRRTTSSSQRASSQRLENSAEEFYLGPAAAAAASPRAPPPLMADNRLPPPPAATPSARLAALRSGKVAGYPDMRDISPTCSTRTPMSKPNSAHSTGGGFSDRGGEPHAPWNDPSSLHATPDAAAGPPMAADIRSSGTDSKRMSSLLDAMIRSAHRREELQQQAPAASTVPSRKLNTRASTPPAPSSRTAPSPAGSGTRRVSQRTPTSAKSARTADTSAERYRPRTSSATPPPRCAGDELDFAVCEPSARCPSPNKYATGAAKSVTPRRSSRSSTTVMNRNNSAALIGDESPTPPWSSEWRDLADAAEAEKVGADRAQWSSRQWRNLQNSFDVSASYGGSGGARAMRAPAMRA